MTLLQAVRERRWVPVLGAGAYVAALAAGYYYNLTFVQLGLVDLGTRLVGMERRDVSVLMAVLAVATLVVALATGVVLDRRGWGADLRIKLRVLLAVVVVQLGLTVAAPAVATPRGLLAWVLVCAVPLGCGIPVMFSLMGDLVPVADRGHVAAVVAGLAFFAAALFPMQWRVEEFSRMLAVGMAAALPVLAWAASGRSRLVDLLAAQDLGPGRFCRGASAGERADAGRGTFVVLVVLMFVVFFVDSLGFLRIVEAPVLMAASWQSTDVGVRVFIAVTHVVGAAMAGVLYTAFARRWLFLWIFGLFAFTHLLYTFALRGGGDGVPPLTLPLFYVLAVSFYTTLNFALWPDLSTARTIGLRTAVGVGVAGWLASFLSTALALWSADAGVPLEAHLRWVDALALLALVTVPVVLYARRVRLLAREGVPDEPGPHRPAAAVAGPADLRR
ncbi:MAG: MFS transporter [Actinotalea sp.]|nr:MFS transporter [Actinotalea sp.]